MVELKRWRHAQAYEKSFWSMSAEKIISGKVSQLTWYAWKASELEKRLQFYIKDEMRNRARILEIGSGPIGIVNFLKWGKRYAIDPLEDFYQSSPVLTQLRNSDINYRSGKGENLPFESDHFSLVILDNVLDHVQSTEDVLKEIRRVLSDDGVLYLVVNLHTKWGAFLHAILSKLKVDEGHPYSFTVRSIRDFISKQRFRILKEDIDEYNKARGKDRKSHSLKNRIKGYSGLSEFVYYAVCSRDN
jgi:SAM-dependent methyltransferase